VRIHALGWMSAFVVVAGCASDATVRDGATASLAQGTQSGFLGDYSNLRPSPRHPDTLYEQSPTLARYQAFIIEPIEVVPRVTVRGVAIDKATADAMALDLRREVMDALSVNFRVVSTPGPGVARVRAALTKVAYSRGATAGSGARIGGAVIEVEIVDSESGQRLGAAIEGDSPDAYNTVAGTDPLGDARLVFRHWSSRLALWLGSLGTPDAPPSTR
jgi:hypothetical protein